MKSWLTLPTYFCRCWAAGQRFPRIAGESYNRHVECLCRELERWQFSECSVFGSEGICVYSIGDLAFVRSHPWLF
jgi:hypothetical protein